MRRDYENNINEAISVVVEMICIVVGLKTRDDAACQGTYGDPSGHESRRAGFEEMLASAGQERWFVSSRLSSSSSPTHVGFVA